MAKKIKTSNTRTNDFKYEFKLYLKNGEKHISDYYTLEGIKQIKTQLEANNEVFSINEVTANDEVNEVQI